METLRPAVFIFDRVMHYHVETFRRLEQELPKHGYKLILLSGKEKDGAVGRAGLKHKIVEDQYEFPLSEHKIGGYIVRHQHQVCGLVKRLKPAVVISLCHSGTLSEWGIQRLKRKQGFRLIAWQCGYEYNPGQLKRFLLRRFVPAFDHHLAYHSNARSYALTHGAHPEQVTVMHNTINEKLIARMPRNDARSMVAKQFPQLEGKQIVLYVGAVLEEKRLETVFAALDILARQDTAFLVVGDGPHLDKLKARFGDRLDTAFAGRVVDGVGAYFDAADMFVLPGTGGLAINEAMAHGIPVISGYADGSADDLVIDGETGYRLKGDAADELAQRLDLLLSNRDLAITMGSAGEKRIRGELSFERFISRVVTVLTGR